jgi:multidrug efflux pump subunit AcrB
MLVFGLALLLVFLVLAAQYENWGIPMSIMMGMPIGVFAALISVALRTVINDTYVQIGLIVIVGLAAKNAVLIVQFAQEARKNEGLSIVKAALSGAALRFRPILMTSLAFIIGTVPMVYASGAGSNSRMSLGTAVSGGMTITTMLGVLFIPVLYVLVLSIEKRFSRVKPVAATVGAVPRAPEPSGAAGE